MKASVIVPTYKHLNDLLKPLCESIIKYTDLSDIEILIIANGCGNDGTKEYVESLGKSFKLIWIEEAAGFTRATNIGVENSCGENIILMNNDCLLLPQEKNTWLNYLLTPLKDRVGMTGNLKIWDESIERYFLVGFLVAIPRFIWNRIGGFDLTWNEGGGGGEDIELCLKVENLGYKILQVPNEENKVIDGINVNLFPNYHRGEGTMMDEEHKAKWEKHIHEVRSKLKMKYRLPPGWFYGGDIAEYRRLVEDVPVGGTICELGCYKGRSLCSVADIIKRKKLKVFVVDIFTGTECEIKEPDYQQEFEDNITRFGIREQVTVIKSTTNEAVKDFPDYQLSLLFIDADHRYEAVKQDLENWECKVVEGGTISGHDFGNWEGVGRAVNERYDTVRVNDQHFGIDSGIATGSIWSKRL